MRVLALLVCAWLATSLGCASPRERLYTLSGSEPTAMTADPTLHVVLGPVTIPAAVDRPQLIVCSVHEDSQTALDMARLMVTQYLGQQPHIMKASGVPASLLDEIGKVLTWPATHDQVVTASKLAT